MSRSVSTAPRSSPVRKCSNRSITRAFVASLRVPVTRSIVQSKSPHPADAAVASETARSSSAAARSTASFFNAVAAVLTAMRACCSASIRLPGWPPKDTSLITPFTAACATASSSFRGAARRAISVTASPYAMIAFRAVAIASVDSSRRARNSSSRAGTRPQRARSTPRRDHSGSTTRCPAHSRVQPTAHRPTLQRRRTPRCLRRQGHGPSNARSLLQRSDRNRERVEVSLFPRQEVSQCRIHPAGQPSAREREEA